MSITEQLKPAPRSITQLKDATHCYVFGATRSARDVIDYLVSNGVRILAIVDNSPEKAGSEYLGYPIINPNLLSQKHAGEPIVIASAFQLEIYHQLILHRV